MKWNKFILILAAVFLIQFYLAELMSIKMVRPDFMSIFILYTSIKYGRFYGVIAGFILGLLTDLSAVGSYFGLSSLSYSFIGYFAGLLKDQYNRLIPLYYHLAWIGIIAFHFFIYCYIRYQYLFDTDKWMFIQTWFFTTGYTMGFILILQLIIPFSLFYRAESS